MRGSNSKVAVVETARGRVFCDAGKRQGVVPAVLLGDIVRAMAYDRRR